MRGGIRNIDAYARGKMLDHSAWQQGHLRLPRKITPSDIDMVFDNGGAALFCEISSEHANWGDLDIGQARLYEAAIDQTTHCAVLCKHSVPLAGRRPINTRADIESFHVKAYDPHDGFLCTKVFIGNPSWQSFVLQWYADARNARSICIEIAKELRAA